MSFDFSEELDKAYSFQSTILLYGFGENVNKIAEEALSGMLVEDKLRNGKRKIAIFSTDDVTDIMAIPYFLAVINFQAMREEDHMTIVEYFNDIEEPLSDELISLGYKEEDFANSTVYTVNYLKGNEKIPRCFKSNNNIFDSPDTFRLGVLSVTKDMQGLGKASSNAIRIYRVLLMYKTLMEKGFLTKNIVDILLYPDAVSQSMFYRDIAIIREIENGDLLYDRKSKVYKPKKKIMERNKT